MYDICRQSTPTNFYCCCAGKITLSAVGAECGLFCNRPVYGGCLYVCMYVQEGVQQQPLHGEMGHRVVRSRIRRARTNRNCGGSYCMRSQKDTIRGYWYSIPCQEIPPKRGWVPLGAEQQFSAACLFEATLKERSSTSAARSRKGSCAWGYLPETHGLLPYLELVKNPLEGPGLVLAWTDLERIVLELSASRLLLCCCCCVYAARTGPSLKPRLSFLAPKSEP